MIWKRSPALVALALGLALVGAVVTWSRWRGSSTPPVVNDEVRPIAFPPPEKLLSPPIIAVDGVSVGYEPGRPVLRKLSLRIDNDDRIALLGANGNGKSTLVKLLAGKLEIKDKVVVAILSGGNVDVDMFAKLIAS